MCVIFTCAVLKWLVLLTAVVKSNLQTLTAKILHKIIQLKFWRPLTLIKHANLLRYSPDKYFTSSIGVIPQHTSECIPVIYRNTEEWERERSHAPAVPAVSFHFHPLTVPFPPRISSSAATPLTGLKWELKSIHMKVQTKAGCVTTILLSQWCILNTIDDFPDTDWANNPITDIMSFNAAYFISQSLLLKMEQNGCLHKSWTNALAGSELGGLPVHLFILFWQEDRKWWEGGGMGSRNVSSQTQTHIPTWAPQLNASTMCSNAAFNSTQNVKPSMWKCLSIYLEWPSIHWNVYS